MDHVVQTDAAERTGSTTSATSSEFGSSSAVDRSCGAKNIVCRYAAALARKLIAAVRTADALEDALVHQ